jgi:mono/diheme cytochrome c family protein
MPMRLLPIITVLAASTAAHAQTLPGDTAAGYMLAVARCERCHVVRENQPPPMTLGVPSFFAVADDPAVTVLGLLVFLQTPHARMPNLILERTEMNDVASYIMSLRDRKPPAKPAAPARPVNDPRGKGI